MSQEREAYAWMAALAIAQNDLWRLENASTSFDRKMFDAGYRHSVALCMNIAAIQTGKKITFDDKTVQVMAGGKPYAG